MAGDLQRSRRAAARLSFGSGCCSIGFWKSGARWRNSGSVRHAPIPCPMKIYLYINAVLYLLLAAWCTIQYETTSKASGYIALNSSGRSEYLVIYGGLQLGVAAFLFYVAGVPEYRRIGLLFAVFLYGGIVAYRLVTVARFSPVGRTTLATGLLELFLLLYGLAIWMREARHS